jgi:Zn-dependent M28 family amino/carboxypeptidase
MLTMLFLGAAVAVAPVSIPKNWTPREKAVAGAISSDQIAGHVRFLADDLLEGRGPASRGSELAMKYIAATYERLGLKPAGDNGSWFQRFAILGLKASVTSPPLVKSADGKKSITLELPKDAIVAPGTQKPSAQLKDAEIVFVGYGITAPEQKWDDYKGVDVKGKVLLMMNNDPENDPALFAGRRRLYYGRWDYKYEEAARHGAAGAIIIHTTPSAAYPWQVVQSSWTGEEFELPTEGEPRVDVRMWATDEMSKKIAALAGQDLDELRKRAESREFKPVALGVKLSVGLKTEIRKLETANVLGMLPGADAKLSKEVIVYSAHHDHLGVKAPKDGDAIYNGALDNASGVGAILSIAEALAHATPKPKRSILFAAVGVEESGLLGSEYFCRHPIVPAGRIAANLNVDGINIWGRSSDIEDAGLSKSTLADVVVKAAKEQGRHLSPESFPERGHYYRSDQFSFARIGVPAWSVEGGLEFVGKPAGWGKERVDDYVAKHYHQPSDQVTADWTLEGAVDDMRLAAVVGLRVADAPAMPAWKAGDEFEGARKKALGDVK